MKSDNIFGQPPQNQSSVRGKTKLQQARDRAPLPNHNKAVFPWNLSSKDFNFTSLDLRTFQNRATKADFDTAKIKLKSLPDYQITANPSYAMLGVALSLAVLFILLSVIFFSTNLEFLGIAMIPLAIIVIGGVVSWIWMSWESKLQRRNKQMYAALQELNTGVFAQKKIRWSLGECGAWITVENMGQDGPSHLDGILMTPHGVDRPLNSGEVDMFLYGSMGPQKKTTAEIRARGPGPHPISTPMAAPRPHMTVRNNAAGFAGLSNSEVQR